MLGLGATAKHGICFICKNYNPITFTNICMEMFKSTANYLYITINAVEKRELDVARVLISSEKKLREQRCVEKFLGHLNKNAKNITVF